MSAGEVPCRHNGYHQPGQCPEANEAAVAVGSGGDSAGITEADCEADLAPTGWSEWDAVAYLLAGIPLFGQKAIRFMDEETSSVDWEGLEAEDRSHGEQLMVELAHNLWNGGACPSVKELVATLDDDNFARALHAIGIARRWRGPSIVRVVDEEGGGL